MNTPPINAVLFDFDGTLAPNLDLPGMRRQVIELTLAHEVPADLFTERYIVEIIDVAGAWLADKDAETAAHYTTSAHDLITEIEMTAAAATRPFPEITAYLDSLRQADILTAVVTRNCRAAVLETFPDLLDRVTALFARDDVTYLKPDTRHLSTALRQLGCAPQNAAMVGDGRLDIHAGKALGMYCVGVLTGSSDHAALTEAGADLILPRCADFNPTHQIGVRDDGARDN